jgi:hypothetical protein
VARALFRTRRVPLDSIVGVDVDENLNSETGRTVTPVVVHRDGTRIRLWMLSRRTPERLGPTLRWLEEIMRTGV